MQIVMFTRSIRSCWNNSNSHFLRGIATELIHRGHDLAIYEPDDSWSAAQLVRTHGRAALGAFGSRYPLLASRAYDLAVLDLDRALDGADLVLVQDWNHPALVSRIGSHRARARSYRLLFHDTDHRARTARDRIGARDLRDYDAVLAVGSAIRDRYLAAGWVQNAFVWHKAADVRVFQPLAARDQEGDLIGIGNWNEGTRSAEFSRFLIEPVRQLGLRATVHGVRHPAKVLRALAIAGVTHGGWVPNFWVPDRYSRFAATVIIPRRRHIDALPSVASIRMFEALACGIPLVSSPWEDADDLFRPGRDYLVAHDGPEMVRHLRDVLSDPIMAYELGERGRKQIVARHTCRHRVDELLALVHDLGHAEKRPERTTLRFDSPIAIAPVEGMPR